MKLFQILVFSLSFFSFFSCQNKPQKIATTQIITLDFQKDLIPEGIAVDASNKKIFLSSIAHRKIVQCNLNGKESSDFIKSKQYNYKLGLGMETFDGKLFAIGSNEVSPNEPNSILLVLDPKTGELIHSYEWKDTSSHFFNDLAISSKGEIYMTNSFGNSIVKLNYPDGEIEKFIISDDFNYGNGIAISDNEKYLYVATSQKGIRIIDIASKRIINPPSEISRGIDGLKFYKNQLIGMFNGHAEHLKHELVRFQLNQEFTNIIGKETLYKANEDFIIPTTFDIIDDVVYFIANSQLRNFQEEKIIERENLKSYILIKHPLSENK